MRKLTRLEEALQEIKEEFYEVVSELACQPDGPNGSAKVTFESLSKSAKLLLQLSGFHVEFHKGTSENQAHWEIATEHGITGGRLLWEALEAAKVPLADLDPELSFINVSANGQMDEELCGSLADGLLEYRRKHAEEPVLLLMNPLDFERFVTESPEGESAHFDGIQIEPSDAIPLLNFRFV